MRIFSEDIQMKFGIKKCAILVMKRGKYVHSEGIKLPDDEQIKEVEIDKGYKYLGILEVDGVKDGDTKERIV